MRKIVTTTLSLLVMTAVYAADESAPADETASSRMYLAAGEETPDAETADGEETSAPTDETAPPCCSYMAAGEETPDAETADGEETSAPTDETAPPCCSYMAAGEGTPDAETADGEETSAPTDETAPPCCSYIAADTTEDETTPSYLAADDETADGEETSAPTDETAPPCCSYIAADTTEDETTPSYLATDTPESDTDVQTTLLIRKALMDQMALSDAARNVAIITTQGHVSLQGSVPSKKERNMVLATAKEIVGNANVDAQINVLKVGRHLRQNPSFHYGARNSFKCSNL